MDIATGDELAACLRTWRERLTPGDAGLGPGNPRRVPGLRREEVAQLAGVSMDYLTRLEQGRATRPSASVLAALARALRLSDRERDHLFRLAGQSPPHSGMIDTHIPPSVQRVMDRLTDVPVLVTTVAGEIVAANGLGSILFSESQEPDRRERTLAWREFMGRGSIRVMADESERERHAGALVADLQSAQSSFSHDTFLDALISDLHQHSERFRELWDRRQLSGGHAKQKLFIHPEVGELTLDCDDLFIQGSGLNLVVFTAEPGSASARALDLLRTIGHQRFGAVEA